MLIFGIEVGLGLERRGGIRGIFRKWNVKDLGRARKGGFWMIFW